MDALTHAVIGASVAQLPLSPAKPGLSFRQKALVGSTAALFPDIDYILFQINPLEFLAYWHRAETHSILLTPFWALILTSGWQLSKRMRMHRIELFWISLIVLLSHILTDSLTMYGTQWLAPVSSQKINMDLLFVIDGYFTICTMIVLSVLYLKQSSSLRWLVILVPIAYLGLVYQLKHHAYQKLTGAGQDIELTSPVKLLPQPFSPFYWQVIHQNQEDIDQAFLRLLNDPVGSTISTMMGKASQQDHYQLPGQLRWRHFSLFPEQSSWRMQSEEVWNHSSFAAFQDFAVHPVIYQVEIANQDTCIWFSDLRYYWPNSIPQFRFGMCRNNTQDWTLYRKRYFSEQKVKNPAP